MNTLLEAALASAREAAPILPLWWTDGQGVCQCLRRADCPSPGEHPLTAHGLDDGTTDLRTIDSWWRQWPRANISLHTDTEPRIDIDLCPGSDSVSPQTGMPRRLRGIGPNASSKGADRLLRRARRAASIEVSRRGHP